MLKIFVTGASGFLGGYVIEELNRRGHEIFGLVRKRPDFLNVSDNVELLVGDLNNKNNLTSNNK